MQRYVKIIALAVCLLLALSACTVDEERLGQQVVVKVGDTEINHTTVMSIYQSSLESYMQENGIDLTGEDVDSVAMRNEIKDYVISYLVSGLVQERQAKEYGVYEPSADELAEIEKKVEADRNSEAQWIAENYGLEDTEEQTALAMGLEMLDMYGYTTDYLIEQSKQELWLVKLKDAVTADVTFTEEELRTYYDEKLVSDRELYTTTPLQYGTDVSKYMTPLFRPDGFKGVKNILISTDFEKEKVIRELEAERDTENEKESPDPAVLTDLQQQIDDKRNEMYDEIRPDADEVLARIKAGESFDALIEEVGEDPGMMFEPEKTIGYMVHPSSNYVPQFLEAVSKLTEVGQMSDLVLTDYGFHIIKYVYEVIPGDVAYEDARDALFAEFHTIKCDEHYEGVVTEWAKAGDVKTWPARLKV